MFLERQEIKYLVSQPIGEIEKNERYLEWDVN